MQFDTYVEHTEAVNRAVQRVRCADMSTWSVPEGLLALQSGDRVSVRISREVPSGDLVMFGTVYTRCDNVACISCGGLLCNVRDSVGNLQTGSDVYIGMTRRRKRRLS